MYVENWYPKLHSTHLEHLLVRKGSRGLQIVVFFEFSRVWLVKSKDRSQGHVTFNCKQKHRISTLMFSSDQVVLVHSNRICLVSLSPNHTVIKDQKKIKSLNFDVSKRLNRLDNKVKGKGKKGGQGVDERSILCHIECENGETYSVRSCVKGKLIGINQKIVQNPNLILDKTVGELVGVHAEFWCA